MSEADIPNPQSEADRGQAIQFPDAIDIEALERASQETETPQQERKLLSSRPNNSHPNNLADAIAIIERLQQEKRQLQERVWDLEALVNRLQHGRKPLKFTSRSTLESPEGNGADSEQSVVETIQVQLEDCQTRMARMEREFALTQQRHDEQTRQLQLSEQNCQELRSRLNRQQRNTLQFKAALEKCLEEVRDRELTASDIDRDIMQVFLAKAQPVEPWSVNDVGDEAPDTNEPDANEVDSTGTTPTPLQLEEVEDNVGDCDDENNDRVANTLETTRMLSPEASPSQKNEPSILPPELTAPKRQPTSKLDLPKFPPLKE